MGTTAFGLQILQEGSLRLRLGVEAERRVSPVYGLVAEPGRAAADQRVLAQASVEQ